MDNQCLGGRASLQQDLSAKLPNLDGVHHGNVPCVHNADVRQGRGVESVEFRCNSPRQWNAWIGVRSSTGWRVTEIEFLVDPCLCILETQRLTEVSKLWEM